MSETICLVDRVISFFSADLISPSVLTLMPRAFIGRALGVSFAICDSMAEIWYGEKQLGVTAAVDMDEWSAQYRKAKGKGCLSV